MKRISMIAAAALLVAGTKLHAQAGAKKADSAKPKAAPAAQQAGAAKKEAAKPAADAKKDAAKPAAKPASDVKKVESKPAATDAKKPAANKGAKKDSAAAKKP
jgi:hypothetical protein